MSRSAVCKCKNRTQSFCFVHKKPVCDNDCLAPAKPKAGEHINCVVKTYGEWLVDAEFDWCVGSVCVRVWH